MRLIDADAYADDLWKMWHNYQLMDDTQTADKIMHGLYRAALALKDAPAIDAVPVVRCKDCKHRDPEDNGCDCAGHEMVMGGIVPVPDNWYCADGERREG